MIYGFLKLILPLLFRIFLRCEISGQENIPRGGVILAANHLSNWDPPVLAAFVPRRVHYMAKQELFDVPLFGAVIRRLHVFPVKRGAADRAAIKTAIERLAAGHCLGLFPEGTRSKDGEMHKPEPGIALIALKADVPVVPAALIGTNRIFSHGCALPKVKIRYGKPLRPPEGKADKAAIQQFAQQIMDEIERLKQEGDSARD